MSKTWIVVAHQAGARVFEHLGPGKGLELLQTLEHPKGRERDRDADSDRPGRSFRKNSGDPRRAAMSRSESPHERAIADFARTLAHTLHDARVKNEYRHLVLIAPPRFLGLLRSSLDGPTSQLIVGSLDKDLASSGEAELLEHLNEIIVA
ncbi:MAG: host attachment protein [Polyangiales bacterium]|jgi:protein required for attachment to host cells